MRRAPPREMWCPVVSETVVARLRRPVALRWSADYFVQCNQAECQYVDTNKPPCPLHVGLFQDEIQAADAARAARRDADGG